MNNNLITLLLEQGMSQLTHEMNQKYKSHNKCVGEIKGWCSYDIFLYYPMEPFKISSILIELSISLY